MKKKKNFTWICKWEKIPCQIPGTKNGMKIAMENYSIYEEL